MAQNIRNCVKQPLVDCIQVDLIKVKGIFLGLFFMECTMSDFNPNAYWEERLTKDIGLHRVGHLAYGKAFNRALYAIRRHVFNAVHACSCTSSMI